MLESVNRNHILGFQIDCAREAAGDGVAGSEPARKAAADFCTEAPGPLQTT